MLLVDLPSIIPTHLLDEWLGAWTIIGGCAMAADKISARIGFDRISERALALIALIGGFAGITLGGVFFHHKTSKGQFWVPIGVAWVIWGAFLLVYFFPRVLTF
jgi:uncharacterized membrane protein YsdA (DUF1294 family)